MSASRRRAEGWTRTKAEADMLGPRPRKTARDFLTPRRLVPRLYRFVTSPLRLKPDFVIIGALKSGTTSLYDYLTQHPCVAPALVKEVHFFSFYFEKGIYWYRAHFPTILSRYYGRAARGDHLVTGEASPDYLFHPHAPKRMRKLLPQAKLIVLLRNPVDRAYSHYNQEVRSGRESLPFEEALRMEGERLRREMEKVLADDKYYGFNHHHYSYLSRGIYVEQLTRWLSEYPRSQFLILQAEALFSKPRETVYQVFEFLGLEPFESAEYSKRMAGHYARMESTTRRRLIAYFEPHNRRLFDLLGVDFDWH